MWAPLRRELRAWSGAGLRLPIWWRDDDATEPTPQLDRLRRLASDLGLPVHLAIIPAFAHPDLDVWLGGGPFRAVVHGWSHQDHALSGMKSAEFGRPRPEAAQEAARGLVRLRSLFGTNVHAMFVPPWNRIDAGLIPLLPPAGFHTLSSFGPRRSAVAAPGIISINAHVDPVDWHGTRGLAEPALILGRLVAHLQARRKGGADAQEPLGLLTHHLMMDDPTWEFCRGLLSELRDSYVDLYDIANRKGAA